MELQSVDGQGVATQKMMLWLMPIMMAIFAFIYTAAFSLYIITSTILSILTNIGINKIVDYQFKRKNFKETENIIRRG
jgi:membrane protein insertase Oxa1/YidC/SpoIIIJ